MDEQTAKTKTVPSQHGMWQTDMNLGTVRTILAVYVKEDAKEDAQAV